MDRICPILQHISKLIIIFYECNDFYDWARTRAVGYRDLHIFVHYILLRPDTVFFRTFESALFQLV